MFKNRIFIHLIRCHVFLSETFILKLAAAKRCGLIICHYSWNWCLFFPFWSRVNLKEPGIGCGGLSARLWATRTVHHSPEANPYLMFSPRQPLSDPGPLTHFWPYLPLILHHISRIYLSSQTHLPQMFLEKTSLLTNRVWQVHASNCIVITVIYLMTGIGKFILASRIGHLVPQFAAAKFEAHRNGCHVTEEFSDWLFSVCCSIRVWCPI